MPSVLALISKAVFEGQAKSAKLGDRLGLDVYRSANAGLSPLAEGGSLFLVTVRPPEQLWLCAILDEPRFDGAAWQAAASGAPLVDVTALLPSLRLLNGKGIQAPAGRLGMSLQTPRALTDEDAALLRGAAGGTKAAAPARAAKKSAAAAAPKATPATKTATKKKAASKSAPVAEAEGLAASPPLPPPTRARRAEPPRRALATLQGGDLLAQIVADPDDVELRRVYADQRTEAGDPHGEFVQLSCAADALDEDDPRRVELERSALALRRRHGLDFSRALRQVPFFNHSAEGHDRPYAFGRGFPEAARGVASRVLAALPDGARAAPLRALSLAEATTPDVQSLATRPELARIRDLELHPRERDRATPAVVALLASPHLTRLERLSLHHRLTPELLRALAASPALDGLVSLELDGQGAEEAIDGGLFEALLRSPRLAGLRRLTLSRMASPPAEALASLVDLEALTLEDVALGARGVAALVGGPGLGRLHTLDLRGCELGDKGPAAIAGAARFQHLRRLTLGGAVNGKHAPSFFDALALPSLRELSLVGGPLREAGAQALVAAGRKLPSLRRLDLSHAMLKDEGATALARLSLRHLEALDLDGNGIAGGGMSALGAGPLVENLRELSLRNNKCGSEGGQNLAAGGRLGALRKLALYYNWMGVKGVRALLAAAPSLEELDAGENNYTDAPARHVSDLGEASRLRILSLREVTTKNMLALVTSPAAQRFEELRLSGSHVDEEAVAALCALPTLELLHLMFVTCDGEGPRQLRARFGPNLTTWGDFDRWQKLPGPP